MYEGWHLHHQEEVEFEETLEEGEDERASSASRYIELEITSPSEEESELWNCYAVTPLKVTVNAKKKTFFILEKKHVKPCTV